MTPGLAICSSNRQAARLACFGLLLACLALGSGLARTEPAADADAASAAAGELAWKWRLAGVVVSPDLSEALFVTEGAARTLKEGDAIDGWTLAIIRPQDVTLRHGDSEKRLAVDQLPASDADAARAAAVDQPSPILQNASAVRAAARAQQKEQKAAELQLTQATKRMMLHHHGHDEHAAQ